MNFALVPLLASATLALVAGTIILLWKPNRVVTLLASVWGVWTVLRTPVDALPDLSDVQVIVATEWMGRRASP
jgi:Cu(I)/Ag(I) efflux system membrane protein CusA/SilA